jgi:hypothetical protein
MMTMVILVLHLPTWRSSCLATRITSKPALNLASELTRKFNQHTPNPLILVRIKEIDVIQEGTIRIDPARSFDDAGLHPAMLANVKLAKYDIPTPVQAYCLPAILKGHDIIACAQTGKFTSSISFSWQN